MDGKKYKRYQHRDHKSGLYRKDNQRGTFHRRAAELRTAHEARYGRLGWMGRKRFRKRGFTFNAVFSPTPLMARASAYDLILVG